MTITKDHLSAINTAKAYKMHYKREKKEKAALLALKNSLSHELIKMHEQSKIGRQEIRTMIEALHAQQRQKRKLMKENYMLKLINFVFGLSLVAVMCLSMAAAAKAEEECDTYAEDSDECMLAVEKHKEPEQDIIRNDDGRLVIITKDGDNEQGDEDE